MARVGSMPTRIDPAVARPVALRVPQSGWRVAVGLLLVAALVASLQVYRHTFVDESENLYFGYRMSEGETLYVDMFSHHFPFPYWWIALTIGLAGQSIFAVRLSLVVLELAAFAAAAWVSAAPIAVGVAAVVWSLVGYLYYGNLLIAYTFKALGLMVVVAGVVFGLPQATAPRPAKLLTIGLFGAVAVLSDPTPVYVLALMAAIVWWRFGLRAALVMCLPIVAGVLGMMLWLHATGSWDAFVRDAVEFNRDVYAVFGRPHASSVHAMIPYEGIWRQATRGLEILDERWWAAVPATPLSLPGGLHDRWLLTGLAYRAYVILAAILFVWRGHLGRALGIYGFAVLALALRGEEGFHASTFALGSILCAAVLVTGEAAVPPRMNGGGRVLRALVATCLAALACSGASVLWAQRGALGYVQSFGYHEDLARRIDAWACHDPAVRVSFWPYDLLVNWFADRLPISKFAYVLPWTLDLSRDELLSALRRERSVVIVALDGKVGPYENAAYLDELLTAMRERFVPIERGVFLSRDLLACQPNAVER